MEPTEPVPSVVVPSVKVTVPVRVAVADAAETEALNVMLVPLVTDVAEAASMVVVATTTGAVLTVTVTAGDVLPRKLLSPP